MNPVNPTQKQILPTLFNQSELDKIKNSKIIIIGGAGYIGSMVSQLFVAYEAKKVIVIDNLSAEKSIRRIQPLLGKDNFEQFQYNLEKDFEKVEELVDNEEPDIILYLASNIGRLQLTQEPDLYLREMKKFQSVLNVTKECGARLVFA